MRRLCRALLLSPTLGACLCTQPFTPEYVLNSPRVLAIRSTPVDLVLDGGVTLDALVYVPPGSPATQYDWTWCAALGDATTGYACALTATALGQALDPDGGLGITINYSLGSTPSVQFPYPLTPAQLDAICANAGFTPDGGVPDAGELDAGPDGGLPPTLGALRTFCGNGATVTVLLTITSGKTSFQAYRTISLVPQLPSDEDTNPWIDGLTVNASGVAPPDGGVPQGGVALLADVSPDASSIYEGFLPGAADGGDTGQPSDAGEPPPDDAGPPGFDFDGGFPFTQTLVADGLSIAWYVEGGQLSETTTTIPAAAADDTTRDWAPLLGNWWVPPAGTGNYEMVLVIRDTRGGIGWLTQEATAPTEAK